MSAARTLTRAVHAARENAAPQEARLRDHYTSEIRHAARLMAARFTELAGGSLTSDAVWTAPSVAQVTHVAVRRGRITRAQHAMMKSVGGDVGDVEGVDFTLTHPIVQGILDKLGARVEATITAAAREPVATAIATSWADGLSVPDTASAIQASVEGVAGYKAVMLARTDLIGMSNGAGKWAVDQLNTASREAGEGTAIATQVWLSSQDDRVRDTHAEADGQEVPIGEMFTVGGALLAYPGDPDGPDEEVINCRCTVLYNETAGDTSTDLEASAMTFAHVPPFGLVAGLAAPAVLPREVPFTDEEDEMTTVTDSTTSTARDQSYTLPRVSTLRAAAADPNRQRWHSDVAFEGMGTGDGRWIMEDALSWREPPLTLMAMVETPDFGGHAGAQVAGRMDTFVKRPTNMDGETLPSGVKAVYSTGVFDQGEYGQDIERMVDDLTLRGVSVDLAVLEWGFRDPDTGEFFNPDEMTPDEWDSAFMGELDFATVKGEIMASTVCPTPAFANARIALLASSFLRPLVWRANAAYAAQMGVPVGQLMTTLTAPARPVGDLVASAAPKGFAPLAPPTEWFFRPEPNHPQPLTITDDGEVYGHIALWETCHTGFVNQEYSQCVQAPRSNLGYDRFHLGEIVTEEGEHLAIGKLTVGTGHAAMGLSPNQVREHYDNTGAVGAFVRAKDGQFGIWVCGATRSDMTPEQLRDLRANPPSGDWRSVDRHLELHAVLAVPVAGFPVARTEIQASARGVEMVSLVLVATGFDEPAETVAEVTLSADVLHALIEGGDALDDLIAAA